MAHLEPSLIVSDLTVRYDGRLVVDDCSLQARPGEVTALIGPNGAGKTTTIEVCVGLRTRTAGEVSVLGADPGQWTAAERSRVGIMLQGPGVYPSARVLPWLTMLSRLYRDPWPVSELMDHLGISPAWPAVRRMSGGQLQLVKFAGAVIGRPRMLFLDEPTAGLDHEARAILHASIRSFTSAGTAVVLTTHDFTDVEALADQVFVMRSGTITHAGTLDDITKANDGVRFQARSGLDTSALEAVLPAGHRVSETSPGHYVVTGSATPQMLATVTHWCAEHGVMATALSTGVRSLDEVLAPPTTQVVDTP